MQTSINRVLAFPSALRESSFQAAGSGEEALLGTSAAIARVREQISRVAPYFRAAVITGEPGTGAESVARALHARSPAKTLPFTILDGEAAERYALQLSAQHARQTGDDEGTVYLPDVGDLSVAAQHRLLSRLRQRSRPVRIVVSTQTSLRAAVSAGRFSLDFAEALSAIRVQMPALRERKEDLTALTLATAQRLALESGQAVPVFDAGFLRAAAEHSWPGNLAELHSLLASVMDANPEGPCTAEDWEAALRRTACTPSQATAAQTRMLPLEQVVQEHIRGVLIACHGNKLRAAEVLGISRSTLYRMLDSYTPARLPLAS